MIVFGLGFGFDLAIEFAIVLEPLALVLRYYLVSAVDFRESLECHGCGPYS